MSNWAIIVAAGQSIRFGDKTPKQFHQIAGKPVLSWTIAAFEQAEAIDQIVVVVSEQFQLFVSEKVIDPFGFQKVCKIVSGGENRVESVHNGLKAISKTAKLAAIHDGVRPLILPADINRVVEVASKSKAAMLAMPSKETVKEVDGDEISKTLPREKIWLAQTPQVFEYNLIMKAHEQVFDPDSTITDDSLLVEKMGVKVKVVEPTSPNIKVTTPDDLAYVEMVLKRRQNG